jgi:hypothetical protein
MLPELARTQTVETVSVGSTRVVEDVSVEIPSEWRRRTLISYSPPEDMDLDGTYVVVTHEARADGDTLHALATRRLVELSTLPEFCVSSVRGRVLDGRDSVELSCEWHTDDGPVAQTVTFVATQRDRTPTVTIVTTTCATADVAAMSPVFVRILDSMRFGRERTSGIAPENEPSGTWEIADLPPTPPIPFIPIPGSRQRGA